VRIAVTGAFDFSGKYIARRLLALRHEVITLTNSPHRATGSIEAFPYNFSEPHELEKSLRGIDALINTYWVRFDNPPHLAIAILRPETIIRWHSPGVGAYSRSGNRVGRPNLGRTAQAHWRDEPCKSSLGCAHTFMVNCSILFGTRTLPMARLFVRRLRAMGIRDKPVAPRSPWQNPIVAERVESRSLGPELCPVGDSASSGPPSWGSAGMPSSFGCRG